jgi:hypothetical protein
MDRDKVIIDEDNPSTATITHYPQFHDMVNMLRAKRKAPRLYKVGNDTSYTLHCFRSDKIEQVVSL